MSGEISVLAQLTDSAFDVAHEPAAQSIDRSGTEMVHFIQSVGTSNELINPSTSGTAFADIATAGWAYFENLDTTNFVQLATQDDATYFAKLLAGEKFVIPLGTGTLYGKADTSAVRLMVTILER